MDYKQSKLWKNAFSTNKVHYPQQCTLLEIAFDAFRERVSTLVAQIHKDMPDLTVHDITHIDALWWTASEIAGDDYEINPAEAFVLGGAFLLHDSAHCVAAYPGGVNEIMALPEWSSFLPKKEGVTTPVIQGTVEFQKVLFEVLRIMHPKQAKKLPKAKWRAPSDSTELYLIPNDELREAYGDAIGEMAESHWSYPHELEKLNKRVVNPPAVLQPAPWKIDLLKVAALLRTADAAHINSLRAPKFLFALTKPSGSSIPHWQFQGRIHDIKRSEYKDRHELIVTGTAFPANEQEAWWLAYDTAKLIDKELRAVDQLLSDMHRSRFAARCVAFINTPSDFSINVSTTNWLPVDTSIKISDIGSIVENFGGAKLYGDSPSKALRELIQNSADAIRACRALEGLSNEEGEIEISLDESELPNILTITDTGIGMSKYVLSEVLIDFGRSLWESSAVRSEWEDLASKNFKATGKFGIGFFSSFMLGSKLKVITHRYDSKDDESRDWVLEFNEGTKGRPTLRQPAHHERLKRHGTRIEIELTNGVLENLLPRTSYIKSSPRFTLAEICASLAPALDINIYVKTNDSPRKLAVQANDWKYLDSTSLLDRVISGRTITGKLKPTNELTDIKGGDEIKARLSIYNTSSYLTESAVGVTNGIHAGTLIGFHGIVKSKPQEDLARSSAIPDITAKELAQWAEEQKLVSIRSKKLSASGSALLIHYGASEQGLIIGKIGGKEVTTEQLCQEIYKLSEILIHNEYITHEDDDDVASSRFDSNFEQESNLIELMKVSKPDWLNLLSDYDSSKLKDSLAIVIGAIERTWGKEAFEITENELVDVGDVNGATISRYCEIFSRTTIPDDKLRPAETSEQD